jgi:ABC-type sugar transport system ATPase subunit
MAIADRVIVMEAGEIIQQGTAEELYRQPSSEFVAALLGMLPINGLIAHAHPADGWRCGGARLPHQVVPSAAGDRCRVAFRPEEVAVLESSATAPPDQPGSLQMRGSVRGRFRFHDRHCLVIERDGATLRALVPPAAPWQRGADVTLRVPYAALHFFSADDEAKRLQP